MFKQTIISIVVFFTIASTVKSQDTIAPQLMRVLSINGTILFHQAGERRWDTLTNNSPLGMGYEIKSQAGSLLQLIIEPVITLQIEENTTIRFVKMLKNVPAKTYRMHLVSSSGTVSVDMPEHLPGNLFLTVETPCASMLSNNGSAVINISDSTTIVKAVRGSVKVRRNSTENPAIISQGLSAQINRQKGEILISQPKQLPNQGTIIPDSSPSASIAILSMTSEIESAGKPVNLESLSDLIAGEINKQSGTNVLYFDDVRKLLAAEGQAQLLNCRADSCISKIGTYLGVDLVVIGRIGSVGSRYIFNLKMIDMLRERTAQRVNLTVDDDPGRIVDQLPVAVKNLLKTTKQESSSDAATSGSSNQKSTEQGKKGGSNTLIWIKGGQFAMGSPLGNGDSDEWPQHTISVSDFYIDQSEVTREQFQKVMGYNPSTFKGCMECPVDNVSWTEAQEYCKKTGKRLPTEAEWEYACKTTADGAETQSQKISADQANFKSSANNQTGKPMPVGSFPPNSRSLLDMLGNLSEWCSDWYSEVYYGNSPTTNPVGPADGKFKVTRGGSWNTELSGMRCSNRVSYSPNLKFNTTGFRCVKESK